MPLAALALDKALQLVRVGDPDIEVAVGREDHAVDALLVEILLGQLIGLPDPFRAGGRAACGKVLERRVDLPLVGRLGRREAPSRHFPHR